MTSVQMQGARNLSGDNANRVGRGSFNGLPNTFRNGFNRQNELRDDLSLDGSASTRRLIRVHKKTGARPDDFNFRDAHAVNVRQRRQLNDDRLSFIPSASHVMRPCLPKWAEVEQSTVPVINNLIRHCGASGRDNSIQIVNPINSDTQSDPVGDIAIEANAIANKSNAFILSLSQPFCNS